MVGDGGGGLVTYLGQVGSTVITAHRSLALVVVVVGGGCDELGGGG